MTDEKIDAKRLAEAMQLAWNEYCDDTGHHPSDIVQRTKTGVPVVRGVQLFAKFEEHGPFVRGTASWYEARLPQPKGPPVSDDHVTSIARMLAKPLGPHDSISIEIVKGGDLDLDEMWPDGIPETPTLADAVRVIAETGVRTIARDWFFDEGTLSVNGYHIDDLVAALDRIQHLQIEGQMSLHNKKKEDDK